MKIAIMTSGGDAPGMNAFVRASVRRCVELGFEPFAIYEGYNGLINNQLELFNYDSVCNIIQRGGTILRTSRSSEFLTKEGQEIAAKNLNNLGITGLICCGGDGSYAGLKEFTDPTNGQWKGQVIGTPGTIDNDVKGTDFTIGFDTAINTAIEAIDKLRDTGDSHSMHFIVEVMGRNCGDIATAVGTASAASYVVSPETEINFDELLHFIRSKGHTIIIIAEGHPIGGAYKLADLLMEKYWNEKNSTPNFRVSVLGHIQRGGSPTARDRILAHDMGVFAVDNIKVGATRKSVGVRDQKYLLVDL